MRAPMEGRNSFLSWLMKKRPGLRNASLGWEPTGNLSSGPPPKEDLIDDFGPWYTSLRDRLPALHRPMPPALLDPNKALIASLDPLASEKPRMLPGAREFRFSDSGSSASGGAGGGIGKFYQRLLEEWQKQPTSPRTGLPLPRPSLSSSNFIFAQPFSGQTESLVARAVSQFMQTGNQNHFFPAGEILNNPDIQRVLKDQGIDPEDVLGVQIGIHGAKEAEGDIGEHLYTFNIALILRSSQHPSPSSRKAIVFNTGAFSTKAPVKNMTFNDIFF
jgi:hypothetical protein